jgi:putative NADH-flavin reductase
VAVLVCRIEQALRKGHSVTAFVRDAKRIPFHHNHLVIVGGNVLNESEVEPAIIGQDAVIVALGAATSSPSDICSNGTQKIVNAMKRHKVSRVVVLTGFGTSRASRKQLGFGMRAIFKLVSLITYREFRDKEKQDDIVRQSGLDWTIIQPPTLTNEPAKGECKHGSFSPSILARISRSDVAAFMVDAVENSRYIKQSTFIHD